MSIAPKPSVSDPLISNFTTRARGVSGNSLKDTKVPMTRSGDCTAKITRQPTESTSGPPRTTPTTGAIVVAKLQ